MYTAGLWKLYTDQTVGDEWEVKNITDKTEGQGAPQLVASIQ
jgi:hypothetical protein